MSRFTRRYSYNNPANNQREKKPFAEKVKTFIRDLPQTAKRLILETPIEIFIGAAIFGAVFGGLRYDKEKEKGQRIPLAFSEIERTERLMSYQDKTAPPLTRYYSVTNDVAAKVFEAHNMAHKESIFAKEFRRNFAINLENTIERSFRVHAQINEYAKTIGEDADNALGTLKKWTDAEKDLPSVAKALDESWDDSHRDVYRTEVRTRTTTDANGNTTTETYTVQVYDHTVHTYDFNKQQAAKADRLLNDFIQEHPDLDIAEKLIAVTQTGADNEYAMSISIAELENKMPTPEQALKYANMWAIGSNYVNNYDAIIGNHGKLKNVTPAFTKSLKTAKSNRYNTGSHSDSGPTEFQIAEAALEYTVNTLRKSKAVTNPIRYADKDINDLSTLIQEFVDVELNYKDGDSKKLQREVMDKAQEIYSKNFKNGFDTHPSKWWMVVLFSVIGIATGAAVGFAADRTIDHFHTKDTPRRNRINDWRRNNLHRPR